MLLGRIAVLRRCGQGPIVRPADRVARSVCRSDSGGLREVENHVLDGVQIHPCEATILRGKGAAHYKVYWESLQ